MLGKLLRIPITLRDGKKAGTPAGELWYDQRQRGNYGPPSWARVSSPPGAIRQIFPGPSLDFEQGYVQ